MRTSQQPVQSADTQHAGSVGLTINLREAGTCQRALEIHGMKHSASSSQEQAQQQHLVTQSSLTMCAVSASLPIASCVSWLGCRWFRCRVAPLRQGCGRRK